MFLLERITVGDCRDNAKRTVYAFSFGQQTTQRCATTQRRLTTYTSSCDRKVGHVKSRPWQSADCDRTIMISTDNQVLLTVIVTSSSVCCLTSHQLHSQWVSGQHGTNAAMDKVSLSQSVWSTLSQPSIVNSYRPCCHTRQK